jgi:hypothetical protein
MPDGEINVPIHFKAPPDRPERPTPLHRIKCTVTEIIRRR